MVRRNTSPRRPRRANTSTTSYGYGWPTDDTDSDTYADNSDTCTDSSLADTSGGCSGGES